MIRLFSAIVRSVSNVAANLFRRLVTNNPMSEYERVMFNALYETGNVYRKGVRV